MSFSNASALDGIPRETLLPQLSSPAEVVEWSKNFAFRMMEARRDWFDAIMRLRSGDMSFIAPQADFTPSLGTHLTNKTYVDAAVAGAAGVPAGTILAFGGSVVPAGYLACNGAAVSRVTYSALFSALSVLWGVGDGATTFNVPDGQRRSLIGKGSAPWDVVGTTDGVAEASRVPDSHTHANTLSVGNESTHTHADGSLAAGAGTAHSHGTTGLSVANESAHTHSIGGSSGNGGTHSHALSGDTDQDYPGDFCGAGEWGLVHDVSGGNYKRHIHYLTYVTTDEEAAHAHSMPANSGAGSAHGHSLSGSLDNESSHTHDVTGSTDAGASHNHSVGGSVSSKDTWPPHAVVLFIIKT
jgi:microcystin-dependent protein